MKKQPLIRLGVLAGLSLIVMLAVPAAVINLTPADAAMSVCILLFYFVNPFFVLFVGVYAGRKENKEKLMWAAPVIPAAVYLFSSWGLFEFGELSFLQTSGIYLLIGFAALAGSAFMKRLKDLQ